MSYCWEVGGTVADKVAVEVFGAILSYRFWGGRRRGGGGGVDCEGWFWCGVGDIWCSMYKGFPLRWQGK